MTDERSLHSVDDLDVNEVGFCYVDVDKIGGDDPGENLQSFAAHFGIKPHDGVGPEPQPEDFGITPRKYVSHTRLRRICDKSFVVLFVLMLLSWAVATPFIVKWQPVQNFMRQFPSLGIFLTIVAWFIATIIIGVGGAIALAFAIERCAGTSKTRMRAAVFGITKAGYYLNGLMGVAAYWRQLPNEELAQKVRTFLVAEGCEIREPADVGKRRTTRTSEIGDVRIVAERKDGRGTITALIPRPNERLTRAVVERFLPVGHDAHNEFLLITRDPVPQDVHAFAQDRGITIFGPRELAARHRASGVRKFAKSLAEIKEVTDRKTGRKLI